jgi:hypothetical protein
MDFLPALALMLVGLVCTILSGVGVATLLNRARQRRPMKRHVARAKREQPLDALESEHVDRRVLVKGQLRFGDDDGAPRAAVAVGARIVELVGHFTVVAGTRSERGREGDAFEAVVERDGSELLLVQRRGDERVSLSSGDEVVVQATFGRRPVRTGGYRRAPEERWMLGRERMRSTITDAHAPPKVPPILRRRFAFTDLTALDRLLGAAVAIVVALGFVLTGTAIDSWRSCHARCSPMGCGFTVADGELFACDYGGDYCASLDACRLHGRCAGGVARPCAPVTDAHCLSSEACRVEGACRRLAAGAHATCRPASDADCQASTACERYGRCRFSASYGGRCDE